ncbi:VP2 [Mudjinabarry virus]|nr:VP2 [Mudjinabarry virus]
MASEMTIAVTEEMKDDDHHVYQHYDVVVETKYEAEKDEVWKKFRDREVWSLEKENTRKALHVGKQDLDFDQIWNLRPDESTILVATEHLKHAIVAYKEKVLEQSIPEIYKKLVDGSIENQMINPGKTDLAGRVTVDTLYGRVHLWGSMAESMCYERKGIEIWKACNHDSSNLIDQLYLMGLYSIKHNPYYYIPWDDFIIRQKTNVIDTLGYIGTFKKELTLDKISADYIITPRIKQMSKELFNMDASWDYDNAKNEHMTRFWDQPKEYLSKKENCVKLVDALRKVAEDLKVNFTMSDTPGLCEKFAEVLADTFKMDIYGASKYQNIPRRKRFAANIVRAADQLCGKRLSPVSREKCLQGVYQVAHALLGSIYNKMEKEMAYKVDDFIRSYQSEKNRGKLIKVIQTNQRITFLQRKNVYTQLPNERHQGITWAKVEQKATTKINMKQGIPYDFCDDDDDEILCASFNDEYYYLYMERIIQNERWDDQVDDLSSLLNETGNILKYNASEDFYINDEGELVLAEYYRKKIDYSLVRHHVFECIDTYTENFNIAHKGSKRLDHDEIKYGMEGVIQYGCNKFDSTSLGEGKVLKRPEFTEIAGGVMAQFAEYMAEKTWFTNKFCKIRKCGKDEIELAWCNSYTVSRFLTWEYAIYMYTMFKNFAPINMRKAKTKEYESVYPDVDLDELPDNLFEISHLSQIPIYLIDVFFENSDKLRNSNQCLRILLEIQNLDGDRRMKLIRRIFPAFSSKIATADVDGMLALNFLPYLLSFSLTDESSCVKRVIPFVYCDRAKMRILPITITDYEGMGHFINWTMYLSKFYGIEQHEKMVLEEDLLMIHPWLTQYYMKTHFLNKPDNVIELSTKRQLVEMWLGQRCGGVSEGLTFIRSSHFPSRGFILLNISDGLIARDRRIEMAKKRFEGSDETLVGTVLVEIKDGDVNIHTQGAVEARILQRLFWGVKHKVIIIKSRGRVFGNELMVTKLMNL